MDLQLAGQENICCYTLSKDQIIESTYQTSQSIFNTYLKLLV